MHHSKRRLLARVILSEKWLGNNATGVCTDSVNIFVKEIRDFLGILFRNRPQDMENTASVRSAILKPCADSLLVGLPPAHICC